MTLFVYIQTLTLVSDICDVDTTKFEIICHVIYLLNLKSFIIIKLFTMLMKL